MQRPDERASPVDRAAAVLTAPTGSATLRAVPSTRSKRSPPPPRDAAWRDGVQLANTVVYCDASRARDLCFVSHAHVAVRGAHRKLLASPTTLALLRAVTRGADPRDPTSLPGVGEVLVTPFGRPFHLGALRLELFPSGHVPGAASLSVTTAEGRRVVYAGDVNPRAALSGPCEVRGADALVLDAPLAALDAPLPPRADLVARLVDRVRALRAEGRAPIVLAPALGVAQEALAALVHAALPVRVHARIHALAEACARAGVALPFAPRFRRTLLSDETLLWPIESHGSATLAAMPDRPRITLRPPTRTLGAPIAGEHIPLCDHADPDALLGYIADTGARDVYLLGDPPAAFVAALSSRRVRVHPLVPPRQMPLPNT